MRLVRRRGTWLVAATALAAALGLALALPAAMGADRYRPLVAEGIRDATGRTATIGRLAWRILPSIGFTAEDVTIDNPAGFGGPPLATMATLRARLALPALLRGRYELRRVEITGLRVHLVENAGGATNYAIAPPATTASSISPTGTASFAIRDAEVVVGRLADPARPVTEAFRLKGLTAELPEVTFAGGRVRTPRGQANLAGAVLDVAGWRPVAIASGAITIADDGMTARFVAALGDVAQATGTLRAAGGRAPVEIDLAIPDLDLERLATLRSEAAAAPADRPPPPAAAAPSPVAIGRLTIERVRYAGLVAGPARLTVEAWRDRVRVEQASIEGYSGAATVTAVFDVGATPASWSGVIDMNDVQIGPLLRDLGATNDVTGTVRLGVQAGGAWGAGSSDTWTGGGWLEIREGVVPGFGRDGVMSKIARLQHTISFGAAGSPQDQAIPYRSFEADLKVAGARIESTRARLESEAGTLAMHGSFGLDGTLRYDGTATLRGGTAARRPSVIGAVKDAVGTIVSQTLGRVRIPFSLRGTFAEPVVNPG